MWGLAVIQYITVLVIVIYELFIILRYVRSFVTSLALCHIGDLWPFYAGVPAGGHANWKTKVAENAAIVFPRMRTLRVDIQVDSSGKHGQTLSPRQGSVHLYAIVFITPFFDCIRCFRICLKRIFD